MIPSLATLLTDPKFSDLVLTCEGQDFNVHRCILCLRSPIFAAACAGEFQAKTRVIDVTVADARTLRRLVAYLYTGDYDDGTASLLPDGESSEAEEDTAETTTELEGDESVAQANETVHNSNNSVGHEDEETSGRTDNNQILMANAYLYIAADYYQIPELMDLALAKFRDASMSFYKPGFADVVAVVYKSGPNTAQELRSILCSTVVRNAASLITDEAFMHASIPLPGFMSDLLPKLVRDYECRLDEEGDRMRESTVESTLLALDLRTTRAEVAGAEAKLRAAEEEIDQTR